jgi:hypothetical protein
LARKTIPLPDGLVKAMAAGKHLVGLHARIGREALEVTLRAHAAGAKAPVLFQDRLALTAESRARLLAKPLALLARDGYHGLTPFFDDRRQAEPDLSVPAPANRWRNPGDRPLAMLYKASWRLGKKSPAPLERLREKLRTAADQGPESQKRALEGFAKSIAVIRADVARCGATKKIIAAALDDLREAKP